MARRGDGAVALGIAKTIIAPFGSAVRPGFRGRGCWVLAAIALALIAFVPLWTDIAVSPIVGMAARSVVLRALVARGVARKSGSVAAVLFGVAFHFIGIGLSSGTGRSDSVRAMDLDRGAGVAVAEASSPSSPSRPNGGSGFSFMRSITCR